MRTLPRLTLPVLALCLALQAPAAAYAQQAAVPPIDSARLVLQLGHAGDIIIRFWNVAKGSELFNIAAVGTDGDLVL